MYVAYYASSARYVLSWILYVHNMYCICVRLYTYCSKCQQCCTFAVYTLHVCMCVCVCVCVCVCMCVLKMLGFVSFPNTRAQVIQTLFPRIPLG